MNLDLERLFSASKTIDPYLVRFINEILVNDLWDLIQESEYRGMSGIFSGIAMRSYCICGRVMISLESEGGIVTFLGYEGPNLQYAGMALHSIHCSDEAAIAMIEQILYKWPKTVEEQRKVYHDDKKVSIG